MNRTTAALALLLLITSGCAIRHDVHIWHHISLPPGLSELLESPETFAPLFEDLEDETGEIEGSPLTLNIGIAPPKQTPAGSWNPVLVIWAMP